MYSTEETEYSGYSRFAGEGLGWAMKVDEEFERKEHSEKGAGEGHLAVVEVAGSMGSMELLGRQVLACPLKMNSVPEIRPMNVHVLLLCQLGRIGSGWL